MKIALLKPDFPSAAALQPYVEQMQRNGIYTNFGPLSRAFEERVLAEVVQTEGGTYAIQSVSSATTGIELALSALQLAPGAHVLLPVFSFVATATAVLRVGLQPAFADIDVDTWQLTPDTARAALKRMPQLAAVLPVAAFGVPVPSHAWQAFSADTGLPVVVDAAGALANQPLAPDLTYVFSTHATKVLPTGEGGLIVSSDARRLRRIRNLSNFGIAIDGWDGVSTAPVPLAGANGKLSELHAAAGLAALDEHRTWFAQRRRLWTKYRTALRANVPAAVLQRQPERLVHTLLPVLLPTRAAADAAVDALRSASIGVRKWYVPLLDEFDAFKRCRTLAKATASEVAARLVGLPFHTALDAAAIDEIVHHVASAVAHTEALAV